MYSETHAIAAKGMRNMFIGQIVLMVAVLLAWIPLVGSLAVLAGNVLAFVGLYTAGTAHPGFKNAMMCVVGNFIISAIRGILDLGFLNSVLSIVGAVLSFLMVYFVCTAAAELLTERGDLEQAQRGNFIWKLNLVCNGVIVVCTVLMFVPILNLIGALGAVVVSIASLVAGILYLVFLYKASASLGA